MCFTDDKQRTFNKSNITSLFVLFFLIEKIIVEKVLMKKYVETMDRENSLLVNAIGICISSITYIFLEWINNTYPPLKTKHTSIPEIMIDNESVVDRLENFNQARNSIFSRKNGVTFYSKRELSDLVISRVQAINFSLNSMKTIIENKYRRFESTFKHMINKDNKETKKKIINFLAKVSANPSPRKKKERISHHPKSSSIKKSLVLKHINQPRESSPKKSKRPSLENLLVTSTFGQAAFNHPFSKDVGSLESEDIKDDSFSSVASKMS